MGLFDWFSAPKPVPCVIIYNVLHEEIDRIEGARDLWNQDLRGRQWQHADLSELSLFGAQCAGINLLGARLHRTDFQRLHSAAQSWRSVTRPVQVSVVLICAAVLFIVQKLAWADSTRPRTLRTPWLMRLQTFQSARFSVSGGCREGHTPDLLSDDRHTRRCPAQTAPRP